MKHKVELVKTLCIKYWHYIPVHYYFKEKLENMKCKGESKS